MFTSSFNLGQGKGRGKENHGTCINYMLEDGLPGTHTHIPSVLF